MLARGDWEGVSSRQHQPQAATGGVQLNPRLEQCRSNRMPPDLLETFKYRFWFNRPREGPERACISHEQHFRVGRMTPVPGPHVARRGGSEPLLVWMFFLVQQEENRTWMEKAGVCSCSLQDMSDARAQSRLFSFEFVWLQAARCDRCLVMFSTVLFTDTNFYVFSILMIFRRASIKI